MNIQETLQQKLGKEIAQASNEENQTKSTGQSLQNRKENEPHHHRA